MAKRQFKLFIRICISGLLLGYLFFKVEWPHILSAFKDINFHFYFVSTLVAFVSIFFIACKYFILLKKSLISHSIQSLMRISIISQFYALFMPSAIGTEAVKWYKITRNEKGRALFLISLVFERLSFVLAILICSLIPLFCFSLNPEIEMFKKLIAPAAIVILAVILTLLTFFLFPQFRDPIIYIFEKFIPAKWTDKILKLWHDDISIDRFSCFLFSQIFSLSLVWQLLFLTRVYLLFKASALPIQFIDAAWIGSLVLLLQILPVSFAGLGVREGAYAYLLTMFQFPPEKGVLIGILFLTQMLIIAVVGGVFELTD